MTPTPWYLSASMWIDISWGFFLLGVILVLLAVISGLAGEHDTDWSHDTDISHDIDLGHDIDHHVDISHDVDHDIDHDISHDIDYDIDFGSHTNEFLETSRSAPLSMLMGTFFLVYGGSGLTLFMISRNVLLNIAGMILIALIAMLTVNTFFKTFFKTGTYRWRPENIVGRRAVVLFEVDARHGTIRVDTGTPLGSLKYPARSYDPNKRFRPGEYIYVIEYREGIAIVDDKWKEVK